MYWFLKSSSGGVEPEAATQVPSEVITINVPDISIKSFTLSFICLIIVCSFIIYLFIYLFINVLIYLFTYLFIYCLFIYSTVKRFDK
jgi:hypothetical protein